MQPGTVTIPNQHFVHVTFSSGELTAYASAAGRMVMRASSATCLNRAKVSA